MASKKKKKAPVKEYVPAGMKREDYADAAFRKKVTIVMGCILLLFIIALVAFIFYSWWSANSFEREKADIVERIELAQTAQEKKSIVIEVNDDDYIKWVFALDDSYKPNSENYAEFDGVQIHIQGMFEKKVFGSGDTQTVQYWLYRNNVHSHDEHKEDEDESEHIQQIPIEIIFADPNQEIPEDGTWIDVRGYVCVASVGGLSAIGDATFTQMDKPAQEIVE